MDIKNHFIIEPMVEYLGDILQTRTRRTRTVSSNGRNFYNRPELLLSRLSS
ncbi:unnamed protein product [Amoebophrya sp. A25]|nr:unnamed protein product [Amoebophrya sp. A25]|eukprot:GSA25T00008842001.1